MRSGIGDRSQQFHIEPLVDDTKEAQPRMSDFGMQTYGFTFESARLAFSTL